MPRARVKFRPPVPHLGGPFKYSVDHPDDDLRILSAYPVDDGLQVVLEATTTETESFVRLFDDVPVDLSVELLHVDDRIALLQFRLPFVPSPFTAIFASKNLPQFPYTLDDGWMVCELTTTHERLSEFDEELDATGFEYEVEWVRQSVDPTDLLTERQREFVLAALEDGYYDTPRRCSLSEVAERVGASKSTVSVVLHRAEETMVGEFFTGVEPHA